MTAMGMKVDGGRFAANLDVLARASDAAGFPARRAEAASRGALLGRGIACFLETARGAPGEWANIRVAPDGSADFTVGSHSNGQGHETSFVQVAADGLGLPVEQVRYHQADTDLIANGRYNNALIMSAQLSSSFLRSEYYNQKIIEKTQILLRWFLCDGAGALVLSADKNRVKNRAKVVDTYIESVGLGLGPLGVGEEDGGVHLVAVG